MNLLGEVIELVKHVSTTPLVEFKRMSPQEKIGYYRKLERRRQKTQILIKNIKNKFAQLTETNLRV